MKSKATDMLRVLLGLTMATALSALAARAQQPSPSPQKDADAKTQSSAPRAGDAEDDYTITSSVELGYRGLKVGGDLGKYQSDLNYKAGPRLFDSSFLMQSKPGAGAALDTLLVTSSGWGADPNGYTRFSVEKSRLFRFDGNYRRFRYYRYLNNFANPNYAPPASAALPRLRPADPSTGEHNYDVRQEVGDFDLTILPKNERLSFKLGYSPTRYYGPVYTNWRQGGDEFNVLADARTHSNEFRVGADWKLGPVDFSFLQGFRRFTDEFSINNPYTNLGANPSTGNTPANAANAYLAGLLSSNPAKGNTDYSRFTGHTFLARKLDLTGRFIYSSSTTNGAAIESLTGVNWNTRITLPGTPNPISPPNVLNRGNYDIEGTSKRPAVVGDFGATFIATDKLRISNTFSVSRYNMYGTGLFNAFFDITRGATNTQLATTGWEWTEYRHRKIQDTVEGDYQFSDRYSIHLGYRYGDTRLRVLRNGYNLGGNMPFNPANPLSGFLDVDETETSTSHAFIGGFKMRPVKTWTLFANVERGWADGILTRIGQYDYTNLRVRSRFTPNRKVAFNLNLITRDNNNPSSFEGVSLEDFGVSVKSRVMTSSVDFTPDSRLSFSGGYNYNWGSSDAVIQYVYAVPPAAAPSNQSPLTGHALYFQRNHFFHLDAVAQPFRRVTFYASYRVNKDTGQGDRQTDFAAGRILASYPFSYQSPEARLSFRVNRRVDANFGYAYYNYNESDLKRYNQGFYLATPSPQNYHAHLPYVSLRFYFGNGDR